MAPAMCTLCHTLATSLPIHSYSHARLECHHINLFYVQVGGLASLIASAIALHYLLTVPEGAISDTRMLVDNLRERDLQFNSQAGAGTGIAVSILLMFIGIAVIVVRFLNFGLVNAKFKIFLSIVS